MARRFAGKVVLITGASSPRGIGAAAARQFADEGGALALVARRAEGLETVASEIRGRGGDARVFPADIRDPAACEGLLKSVADAFGGIDVLVNNAATNARGPVEKVRPVDLASVIQTNLIAPIVLSRLALPYLRARGGGRVVQVASIAGQIPLDGEAAYSASKFGLRAFSFALREELRGSGVEISVISPGPVDTGFIREDIDEVPNLVFANPMSSPEEVARLVLRSAADGRRERTIPVVTGILARVGATFPSLRRLMVPVMERQGRRAKEAFRSRMEQGD